MPWQNHSWHTTLYVTARGLSTGSMPYSDGIFDIEFDFTSHELIIHTTFNDARRFSLKELTVAGFYEKLFRELRALKIDVSIYPRPNELKDTDGFPTDNLCGRRRHSKLGS